MKRAVENPRGAAPAEPAETRAVAARRATPTLAAAPRLRRAPPRSAAWGPVAQGAAGVPVGSGGQVGGAGVPSNAGSPAVGGATGTGGVTGVAGSGVGGMAAGNAGLQRNGWRVHGRRLRRDDGRHLPDPARRDGEPALHGDGERHLPVRREDDEIRSGDAGPLRALLAHRQRDGHVLGDGERELHLLHGEPQEPKYRPPPRVATRSRSTAGRTISSCSSTPKSCCSFSWMRTK